MSDQTRATLRAIAVAWVFGVGALVGVGQAVAAAGAGSYQTWAGSASELSDEPSSTTDPLAPNALEDVELPGLEVEVQGGFEAQPTTDDAPALSDQATGTLVIHATTATIDAVSEPGSTNVVASLDNPTRHGTPLVLQAVTPPNSPELEDGWVEVLLPIRPNGTTAWVALEKVETSVNPFSLEVDVDDFELTVRRNGAIYMTTPVAIGDGDTPTPHGSFFLTDLLQPDDPDGIYGPFAYGLSGYSETLTSFNGGEGVIGIHGTNEPWALGSTVSHGCVRVDNAVIEALSTFLPLGTPVTIGVEP